MSALRLDIHSPWDQGSELLDPLALALLEAVLAPVEHLLNGGHVHVTRVVT